VRGAFPRLPACRPYNRTVRAYHDAIVAVGQRLARLRDAATCAYTARRQIIETVNDRLLDTFGLERERPHAIEGA